MFGPRLGRTWESVKTVLDFQAVAVGIRGIVWTEWTPDAVIILDRG